MTDKQSAIVVKDLFKSFKLPHEQHSGVKQYLVNLFNHKTGYEVQHVIGNTSFEVKRGEFFGIVGRNGSGKSTLLKLLAGIYVPDKGLIQVNGSLTPFIELGVGFNPELTGRENIFLNGALLGFGRSEMDGMYDNIVEFAELDQFMDQKLKNYSSGMQVRLAFSIAIRAQSDILLIDEVLAVGDADFQKKCFNVFRELKKNGKTIVLVTHDMGNVERFCDRVLILHEGRMLDITTPSKAASIYARLNINDPKKVATDIRDGGISRWGVGGISIKKVTIKSSDKREIPILNSEEAFELSIEIEKDKQYADKPFSVGISFNNQDNIIVAGPNTLSSTILPSSKKIIYRIARLPLNPGDYNVTVGVFDKESSEAFDLYEKAISFHVISDKITHGIVSLDGEWSAE